MPAESETAYPRFRSTVTDRELREVYTPTPDERNLARQHTTGNVVVNDLKDRTKILG
jgi:hypothetical protein